MSPAFRNGRVDDIPPAARIVFHSFPNIGLDVPAWEAVLTDSTYGGVETLWVGEEGSRLVAACRLYRFEQWIAGARIPIMGLGMVAISPTHRRRGLAAELVVAGLRHARERGDLATALYPFRTAFYRKLGYGMAGEVLQYRVPPAALPDDVGRERVHLGESPEDRAGIAAVYDRWAAGQTGQLVRPARAWERVWQGDTRHGALFRDSSGEPTGYAIIHYLAEPARGGRAIEVEEIAWLTTEARRGLYGWLASLSDQWDQVVYRAHPEEGFAEHLSELRYPTEGVPRWHFWFPTANVLVGPMFRLLDLPAAWAARHVRPNGTAIVALEVHDPHLPENEGAWTLRIADGRVEVERGCAAAAELQLRIGIEPLSRIYIGALSPSTAVTAGLATCDAPDALSRFDDLLRVPSPWTFDRF